MLEHTTITCRAIVGWPANFLDIVLPAAIDEEEFLLLSWLLLPDRCVVVRVTIVRRVVYDFTCRRSSSDILSVDVDLNFELCESHGPEMRCLWDEVDDKVAVRHRDDDDDGEVSLVRSSKRATFLSPFAAHELWSHSGCFVCGAQNRVAGPSEAETEAN